MTTRFARVLLFLTAFCVYIADRVAKLLALKMLHLGQSIELLPGVFHITLVFNKAAAFGLLMGWAVFFISVSAIAILSIMVYAWKSKSLSTPLAISLGLILGGALGNIVDRLSFGYVIDFFDFRIWPVFNVADSAISIGVVILILAALNRNRHNASDTL
jgi:signal peptidase II